MKVESSQKKGYDKYIDQQAAISSRQVISQPNQVQNNNQPTTSIKEKTRQSFCIKFILISVSILAIILIVYIAQLSFLSIQERPEQMKRDKTEGHGDVQKNGEKQTIAKNEKNQTRETGKKSQVNEKAENIENKNKTSSEQTREVNPKSPKKLRQESVSNTNEQNMNSLPLASNITSNTTEQLNTRHELFDIPRLIWMPQQAPENYLAELYIANIKYFTQKSGYSIKFVSEVSYHNFLTSNTSKKLTQVIQNLRNQTSRQNIGLTEIINKLILLNILYQNGGAIIKGSVFMTQDLSWIDNIGVNNLVNGGRSDIKPQIVGFYLPTPNSQKKKFNLTKGFEGREEVEKYVNQFPILLQYFIAGAKGATFLGELINKMYDILANPKQIQTITKKYNLTEIKQENVYSAAFGVSSQIILRQKQQQLDKAALDGQKYLAIHYYGINLINTYYGANKIQLAYPKVDIWFKRNYTVSYQQLYFFMSRSSYEEVSSYIGPFKYFIKFQQQDVINECLVSSKNGTGISIFQGSLVQKILFPLHNQSFIIKSQQKSFEDTSIQEWKLPKIIWIYWNEGIYNASLFHQICFETLKRNAELSGFQVREVNNYNLEQYIKNQTLQKINKAIALSSFRKDGKQIWSDFYRLALIEQHGGVYMDSSVLTLQDFSWLLNIGKFPSQFIFNRFGKNPKVLMIIHPSACHSEDWVLQPIDENKNIKVQWLQGWQNSFIAAEKGNELISQWFQTMLDYFAKPISQFESLLKETKVDKYRWTFSFTYYLFAMDILHSVIGRRQLIIEKQKNPKWATAVEYYNLWAFNSYLGPTKIRSNINYEQTAGVLNRLYFRYPMSSIQQMTGLPRFFIKFFGDEASLMSKFIMEHEDGNFDGQVHSESMFMKYIWNSQNYKIEKVNQTAKLKIVKRG